jgi:hypothetical protein
MFSVDSSMIVEVGYCIDSGDPVIVSPEGWIVDTIHTLVVRFKDNALWAYVGVPESIYKAFMDADSLGKGFHQLIRNNTNYDHFKWEDGKSVRKLARVASKI